HRRTLRASTHHRNSLQPLPTRTHRTPTALRNRHRSRLLPHRRNPTPTNRNRPRSMARIRLLVDQADPTIRPESRPVEEIHIHPDSAPDDQIHNHHPRRRTPQTQGADVNRTQVIDILKMVVAADRRTADSTDVDVWEAVIGELDFDRSRKAVLEHLREAPGK